MAYCIGLSVVGKVVPRSRILSCQADPGPRFCCSPQCDTSSQSVNDQALRVSYTSVTLRTSTEAERHLWGNLSMGSDYYDRQGKPIGMRRWCELFESHDGYRRVAHDTIDGWRV